MNPWLYPLFAILYSVLLMGYIMDKLGFKTIREDEEGNEYEFPVYSGLLKQSVPVMLIYLAIYFWAGMILIIWEG